MIIKFTKLKEGAQTPKQAYPGDAGFDLSAVEDVTVLADELTWIYTGLAVAIPRGFFGRIVGRSSAASRGLHVVEGVIDAGFRGELACRVIPFRWPTPESRVIRAGESVGQLIIQPCWVVNWRETGKLPESQRGTSGFGSSGR